MSKIQIFAAALILHAQFLFAAPVSLTATISSTSPTCPPGQISDGRGVCVDVAMPTTSTTCAQGQIGDGTGTCVDAGVIVSATVITDPTKIKSDSQLTTENLKSLMAKLKGCMWVDSIDDSTEPSDASGYQVPGCGGSFETKKYVFTGTLKCSFNASTGQAPIFFENVMCTGVGERAPAAIDCLKDGGALKSVSLKLTDKGSTVVSPTKSGESVQGAK